MVPLQALAEKGCGYRFFVLVNNRVLVNVIGRQPLATEGKSFQSPAFSLGFSVDAGILLFS